ncbi:MAG: hypothetical protein C4527_07320 [Candidatus Omnitrophota bacterium]|jgi:hypothetical protein|nr:MAG: hypothetical protein C4527_07320 [Candidatus Omnitrophota bacterium]
MCKYHFRCLIIFFILTLFGTKTFADTDIRVIDLVPQSGFLEHWKIEEGPEIYTPETLYEIINGAATLYLSYGFREQAYARYVNETDAGMGITAYIYDQGSVEGGYGVYSSSRHANENFQAFGTQGYRSGSIVSAWKGRFYISLSGDRDDETTAQALETLARSIMSDIPGNDAYPKILKLLPEQGKVKNSELYTEKDYLGFDFLTKAVSASYRVESITAVLFVSRCPNREKANAVFQQLETALAKRSESVDMPYSNMQVFGFDNRSLGKIMIACREHYVFGAFAKWDDPSWTPWNHLFSLMTGCSHHLTAQHAYDQK